MSQESTKEIENTMKKANSSFKWAALSEILAKIMTPILNIILARLLAPEVFGIVASVSLIISLGDTLAEGGFAKFLLEKQFTSEKEEKIAFSTAFISSFVFSILIYLPILIWKDDIAVLVGAEGYGTIMALSGLEIPLYSIASILFTVYRKFYFYKKLSIIRFFGVFGQGITAITLVFLGFGPFSIVIGTLSAVLIRSILLFCFLPLRFGFHFSKKSLFMMFSSSALFLLEAFLAWTNSSADVFIISKYMGLFDAGIFNQSISTSVGVLTLLSSIYVPILTTLLASFKMNQELFNKTLLKYQRLLSYLFIPLAFGFLLFRNFLSSVFFGEGWTGSALLLGLYSFSTCIKMSTGDFVVIAFNAKEKPQFNIVSDIVYFCFILLGIFLFGNHGFQEYSIVRSFIVLVPSCTSLMLGKKYLHLQLFSVFDSLTLPVFLSCFMCPIGLLFQEIFPSFWWQGFLILVCICVYFFFMNLFVPEEATELKALFFSKVPHKTVK